MKYCFDQYYYTAAPDLFDQARKNGWGIFGSSTPDNAKKNEQAEQISKDWVPMRLVEEKAFPVEYVMYYEDRYVVGGTLSCNTLIQGDNRPNIWTHVFVPDAAGTDSFLACLEITSFDRVKHQKQKMVLPKIQVETNPAERQSNLLKSWEEGETDALLLKELLSGLSGAGTSILITDHDLAEDDFEGYQRLARAMMRKIYQLLPGCFRREMNFITPMAAKYFQLASERPKGGRFYFGPEDQYEYVLSMQDGRKLQAQSFYDRVLIRMADLYHGQNDVYEEIGQKFQKNSYAIQENDYLWHFIYEMLERDIEFDWTGFGKQEYLDAYNQAWNDETRRTLFFKLTSLLLEQKRDFYTSPEYFSIYCRMIRMSSDLDPESETSTRLMDQMQQWILGAESFDRRFVWELLQVLSDAELPSAMSSRVRYDVMQNSPAFLEEAKKRLRFLSSVDDMKVWCQNYSPVKEHFQQEIQKKLEQLFTDDPDEKSRMEVLTLDQTLTEGKVRTHLTRKLSEELSGISFYDMRQWELWKEKKGDLAMLDRQQYQKREELWKQEFWKQVKEKDILLQPSWRGAIREIAGDLKIDWEELCRYFSADMKKASMDWEEDQIRESRKLAKYLEPSIRSIFENICDEAQNRLQKEEESDVSDERGEEQKAETQSAKSKKANSLLENMHLIMLASLWVIFDLTIYEGILQSEKFGPLVPVVSWAVVVVLALALLIATVRRKEKVPRTVILFLASFFWIACAAIIRVMFGLPGEVIYLGIVLILILLLYWISVDSE